MRLAVDLSLARIGHNGGPPFDPLSLFAGSEVGVIYDPFDLASMFQDSAGTVPAAIDSPVGLILDKSGGARHASQATSSRRPILRQDGQRSYLEFDGVDDFLRATFTISEPFTRIGGIRQISWTDQERIFGAALTNSTGEITQRTVSPRIALIISTSSAAAGIDTAAVGADVVLSEVYSPTAQSLTVNNGPPAVGVAGSSAPNGITIAAQRFGTGNCNMRFYGVVMIARALTTDETAHTRAWIAAKAGAAL